MKASGRVTIRIEPPYMYVRFHDLGPSFSEILHRFKEVHQGTLRWKNSRTDRTRRYWQGSTQHFRKIYQFCLQHFGQEQIEIIWGSDQNGYHQESMFS
jgi:hypothetical protein